MTPPRAPSSLGRAGKALWRGLTADFEFPDAAALELLACACRAADVAEAAREAVAKSGGPVITDRFGKPQRHPGIVIERDATATLLACLKALGMEEVGPKNLGGRPPGS